MEFRIGLDTISSYKRLAYTPWHAIAEFIDNATQSYFNNREALEQQYASEETVLEVSVVYDRSEGGLLRIADTAMGMSEHELENALHVARPPSNTAGRSKYGMGLKTAAAWIGNIWKIRTKKLGETTEYTVAVDVDEIASGKSGLKVQRAKKPASSHYTIIEITDLNRSFHGRTLGTIKRFLASMYREDFRNNRLTLRWQGSPLQWGEIDDKLLCDGHGNMYKKPFAFDVDGKQVTGWVGILGRGSRAEAGFSMFHAGRVVKGYPDSWRPSSIYGQLQGSNDLVNQRLVGEIHLDPFDVSHTKDDILWLGDEEEQVEQKLLAACSDYRTVALEYRKGTEDSRGPSQQDVDLALDEIKRELESPEIADYVSIIDVPPVEALQAEAETIAENITKGTETFSARVGPLVVRGYLPDDMSSNDPYVIIDCPVPNELSVIINLRHPHWTQLEGPAGIVNYLRHCVYDGIAEWKASQIQSQIDPNTVKKIKDGLLRISFSIEMHAGGPARAAS